MIGVIADDLSGAAEIGGIAWCCGLRVKIISRSPLPSAHNGVDVVCVDTDSRLCGAEESADRVAEAVLRLRKVGVAQFYKKVDSVLRGNVVAEIESILRACDLSRAILAPANPSRGRVIRHGCYLVNEVPLHETEFARDPTHPRLTSHAVELLRPHGTMPIRLAKAGDDIEGEGVYLAETANADDVQGWAERTNEKILPAGGADLFRAWLTKQGHAASPERTAVQLVSGQEKPIATARGSHPNLRLFVCGSTSNTSKAFVQRMRERAVPVFSLPIGLLNGGDLEESRAEELAAKIARAFDSNSCVIVNIGLPLATDATLTSRFAQNLVRLAAMVLHQGGVTHVYCEGGATAAALMNRMGWNSLRVEREVASGIVMLQPDGANMMFTVKPGSYAWPETVL